MRASPFFTGNETATCVTRTSVTYQQTEVAHFDGDTLTLDNGGWVTATTAKRMNQALQYFGIDAYVFRKAGRMYVNLPDGETKSFNGNWIQFPLERNT